MVEVENCSRASTACRRVLANQRSSRRAGPPDAQPAKRKAAFEAQPSTSPKRHCFIWLGGLLIKHQNDIVLLKPKVLFLEALKQPPELLLHASFCCLFLSFL